MHPQHRLRSTALFERARRQGRSRSTPLLVLNAVHNDEGVLRFGFSVSRRVGSAVTRNRLRRRLRELLRKRTAHLPAGWDLVFIARPAAAQASFAELSACVDGLLQRARLAPPVPAEQRSAHG